MSSLRVRFSPGARLGSSDWRANWMESILVLLSAWATQLLILGPCLGGRFFADDWEFLLDDPCREVGRAFMVMSPYDLWRPLQLVAIAASQCWFGSGTQAVHLLVAFIHALTCTLVWRITRQRWGRLAAWLAVAMLSVSQFSIPAVASNDTLSLVLGTCAGVVALWAMVSASQRAVWVALGSLGIALLSKESSIGYSLVLAGWGAWRALDPRTRATGLLVSVGAISMTVLYLVWRGHITGSIPGFQPDPRIHLGPQVFTHLGMLLVPVLLPCSTTRVFLELQQGNKLLPTLAVLFAVSSWLVLLRSAVIRIGVGGLLMLSVLSVSGLIAVLPLRHVSELYAYAALPGLSVLFGVATATGMASPGRRRILISVVVVGWLATQAALSHEKASQMYANGERAAELARNVLASASMWPHGAKVVMLDDVDARTQYSLFEMAGFRLLPPEELRRVTGRADINPALEPASSLVGADTAVVLLSSVRGRIESRVLPDSPAATLSLRQLRSLASAH